MYENGKISREELAQAIGRINREGVYNMQWGVWVLEFKTDAADYTAGKRHFILDPGAYLYCYMTEKQHREFHREREFAIYDSDNGHYCYTDYVVLWRIS